MQCAVVFGWSIGYAYLQAPERLAKRNAPDRVHREAVKHVLHVDHTTPAVAARAQPLHRLLRVVGEYLCHELWQWRREGCVQIGQ